AQLDKQIASFNAVPPTPSASGERFLKHHTLILDLQARRGTLGDKVLSLPPAAFDYLAVLARHAPNTVDYQTLVNEAQGYQTESFQAKDLAKWHIHQLREALEPDPDKSKYIVNMRGVGYRLVVD
ncbi:MAG: winged helix-turn-helix domain-containing protein, partial [Chloroflexota bacterium]